MVDFLIGATLMNAMPHFVLGTWKGRIPSLFGLGPRANLAYSMLNFAVSIGLFVERYGIRGVADNGLYAGALCILGLYYVTGRFFYRRFDGGRPRPT